MNARLARALLIMLITLVTPLSFVHAQDGQGKTTVHVVQRGDTLFKIAQQYGTTVEAIAQANGLTDVTMLTVGQRLLIPNATSTDPGVPTTYLVQPSDSLRSIALRFGTSIADLAKRNFMLNPQQLYVGLQLAVQESSTGAAGIKTGWLHTVTSTDTLYRVSMQYGVTLSQLLKANALNPDAVLFPGQQLIIPGTDKAPSLVDLPMPFTGFSLEPATVVQGETNLLRLTTALPVTMTGSFLNQPLIVFTDKSRVYHIVIFGEDSLATPGIYPMTLNATDDQGRQYQIVRNVEVQDGGYPSEALTLDPALSDLINPAVTVPEDARIHSVVMNFTLQRYFNGPLGLPCSAAVTSQYGTRRSYNGGPYSFVHAGVDFAAAMNAPIFAAAAGVVVLAEPLTVRGNAVIIDHGWGVYTGYWHQIGLNVKVGDKVEAGQIIGYVGNTGRVTGPHLHWELFVHGLSVDPLQWVRQSFL